MYVFSDDIAIPSLSPPLSVLQVTASERAGNGNMDNINNSNNKNGGGGSPRGSKRPAEKPAATAMTEQEAGGSVGENKAAAPDNEDRGEEGAGGGKKQQKQGKEDMEEEEGEGDLAAGRGDLEFCQRNEVGGFLYVIHRFRPRVRMSRRMKWEWSTFLKTYVLRRVSGGGLSRKRP